MQISFIYLITYDITDNAKRTKAAKLLIKWGYERLQFSVFTGLQHPVDNNRLWQQLKKTIDTTKHPTDKIMVIPIQKQHFKNMKTLGEVTVDTLYLLGERHTLFI